MYPKYVRNVSKLCPKCIQIMFKMYPNYVQYVFKSCPLCTIRYRNMYSLKIRPLYFVIFWINNRFVRWGKSLEKYAIYANIYKVLFPLETKRYTQKKLYFLLRKTAICKALQSLLWQQGVSLLWCQEVLSSCKLFPAHSEKIRTLLSL